MAYYLRFPETEYPIILQRLLIRGIFFTFVIQLSFYYFELYDLKIIRDFSRFRIRFAQSIAGAIIVLMIAYYIFPTLYFGRGVLFLSTIFSTSAAILWRIVYRSMVRGSQLNERIIILGTGEFAREIAREIGEKGDSGFEVIGYVENKGEVKHEIHGA